MNPHAARSVSPLELIKSIAVNRSLIFILIERDIFGRYRGATLGLLWSFFNPLLMLIVYTFVFSVVFKARWSGGTDSKTEFAMILFSGLMVFNIFSECIGRAPLLVVNNVNYVKKIIFPLEVLPLVALGTALFHFIISVSVWMAFYLIFFGIPPLSMLYLPIILLPLILLIMGFSWILASLSVYLRDIVHVVGVITTVIMFLSPVFYPVSTLPEKYQAIVRLNPLADILEQARGAMIWGRGVDWLNWTLQMCVAAAIAWAGFAWFQKMRKGFADVI